MTVMFKLVWQIKKISLIYVKAANFQVLAANAIITGNLRKYALCTKVIKYETRKGRPRNNSQERRRYA